MNCEYVDQLLPFYIGRDLEEDSSRLVAAHLQSCTQCAQAAEEYAGVNGLLQELEPPEFSPAVYAGIRRQVLNEIERTSHARPWSGVLSQFFGSLVQPRAMAIAAAVLLATLIAASYFVLQRSVLPREQVADGRRPIEQNANSPRPDNRSAQSSPQSSSSPSDRPSNRESGVVKGERLRQRDTAVVAVAQSREGRPGMSVTRVEAPPDVSSAPAPLRMEMQTSDPNIRIIWSSSSSQGGAKDTSKGI